MSNNNTWVKVSLKSKDKNLPPFAKRVLFAEYSKEHNGFHKFIGEFYPDGYICDSKKRMKLTSNFYWMGLPDDPEIEEKSNGMSVTEGVVKYTKEAYVEVPKTN